MKSKGKFNAMAETMERECIGFRIRFLNRAVTAIYDDALRSSGLTGNQFNLLVVVSRMEKPTAKKVAHIMQMDPSTVSRSLERMRKEGWLRGTPGDDARYQELSLTEKGVAIFQKAFAGWEKAQKRVRELLGNKSTDALKSVADQFLPKRVSR